MNEEDKGKINRLNDTLNSRTRYHDPLDKRSPLKAGEEEEVVEKWQTPPLDEMLMHERTAPKVNPLMRNIFLLASVFFLGAIGVAIFVFLGGTNFVSSKNVEVEVLGPTTASAGEVFELGVSVTNANNADLELANLSVQYPKGSRNPDNTAEALTYKREDLGAIKAGAEALRNVPMVILGAVGEEKEIKFSLEYKVKGSNATFYKDKIFKIILGESPVSVTITSPSSIVSGEEFTTAVSVTLNSTEILKNVVLKAEYPHGYSVTGASIGSTGDNKMWLLGDLVPGSKKTISIRGRLAGENQEERTFRFYVGVSDGSSNPDLKIAIVSLMNTVSIERPSIGITVLFNGENDSVYIAPPSRPVSTAITFRNNLSAKLLSPRIEVSLSGSAVDKSSVSVRNGGIYDSGSSRAIWNWSSGSSSELDPGDSGRVEITFNSMPVTSLSEGARDITLDFLITGVPVGAVGQDPIVVRESRIVRVASQVSLSAKSLYSLGPFSNQGPIPPKVGEATTYTAVFSVGNTSYDIIDAKVTAKLGSSVSWIGVQSFTSEKVTYDKPSNTVTWDIGKLSSGSGFSSTAREMSFQVSLEPSVIQVGTVPTLVSGIIFSGRDSSSGQTVTINHPSLSTNLSDDPIFIQGDDIVVQ